MLVFHFFLHTRLDSLAGSAVMASSSFLDSEATFSQQATEAGLGEQWIKALKGSSLSTFAKLSFAVTSPGVAATDDQINASLGTLRRGIAPSIADMAAFKRVLFESQTLMMHSLKATAKGEETTPKKMSAPEREARLELQRQTFRGLDISGPLEPAHSLYDLCAIMVEKNEVAYIGPTKCLSRQQELMGSKPEKELQLDVSKTSLVVKEQANNAEIHITSDLSLYQALQRRTLALDLTGIASYEVMRKWIDRFFFHCMHNLLHQVFSKISQSQLLRADRQAFIRMSELFTGSLKAPIAAGKPLDPYIEKLESDMTVTYFMLPVPTSHASSWADKSDKDKKRPEAPNTKGGQPPKKVPKGNAKGNSKGQKEGPNSSGLERPPCENTPRRTHMLWFQFGNLQAGIEVPQTACLLGAGMLQSASPD